MVSQTITERIAKLEAMFEDLDERFADFKTESAKDRDNLRIQYANISLQLERQKNFVGGVVFMATALWAVIVFAKDWFIAHIR